jgi:hypothetical protein
MGVKCTLSPFYFNPQAINVFHYQSGGKMKTTPNWHFNRAALAGATVACMLLAVNVIGVLAAPLQTPPSNDDISAAITITLPAQNTVVTDLSVTDYTQATPVNTGDPSTDPLLTGCGVSDAGLNTVWYQYTATANAELHVDTFTSGYDTVLAAWTGTVGNLTPIICNDDTTVVVNGIKTISIQSEVRFPVTSGTTYYIEVATFTSSGASLSALATTNLIVHFSYRNKPAAFLPPSVPTLVSPANNGIVTTLTPRLDWSTVTLQSGTYFYKYWLELATNLAFTTGVAYYDIFGQTLAQGNSEYTFLSDLNPNTRYYWRVKACSAFGDCSGFSSARSFMEAILPPVLDSPVDAAPVSALRPVFDWENVTGAGSYTIQASKLTTFSTVVLNVVVPGALNSTYTPTLDLPAGFTLYWRVRANAASGSFGPSGWSEVWSIITPKPPSIPTLVSPLSNSLTTNYQPVFDWNNVTVPVGTTFDHYEIQIATDSAFSSVVKDDVTATGNIAASNYPLAPVPMSLTPDTKYFWHVRSADNFGNTSSWSATWTLRAAILPPTLLAPANASAVDHLRPTFDWSDATLPGGYTLQVSNVSSFATVILNVSVTPSTYTPIVDLPAGATLYWRVRATGPNGPSLWTAAWHFTAPRPPSIPMLVSPVNNALTSNRQPTFNWNDVTVPLGTTFGHYQFQIATDLGFTSIVDDHDIVGNVTDSVYQVAPILSPNTKYYWHVRAYDTLGNYSSWSSTWALREAMDPPTLVAPLDGTFLDTLKPAFDWSDVTGISVTNGYTLQVSKLSNFSSLSLNVNVTPSAYTPLTNLPGGSLLYWRVRANGVNGPSAWANYLTLITPNAPPVLSTPTNLSVVTSYNPTLDWVTPTLAPGTSFTNYEVQVANDSGFSSIADSDTANTNVAASSYAVATTLTADHLFYWHVRYNYTDSSLGSHTTAWSATLSFKTAIPAPTLLAPADGTNPQSDLTPTFDWTDVTGAGSYMIQVSTSPVFATTVISTTVSGATNSTFTPGVPLAGGTTFYWRVRANAAAGHYGPSAWSTVFTFTTP